MVLPAAAAAPSLAPSPNQAPMHALPQHLQAQVPTRCSMTEARCLLRTSKGSAGCLHVLVCLLVRTYEHTRTCRQPALCSEVRRGHLASPVLTISAGHSWTECARCSPAPSTVTGSCCPSCWAGAARAAKSGAGAAASAAAAAGTCCAASGSAQARR